MNCSTNCVTHVHFTFSAHSPQSSSADRNDPFYISADAPYDRKTNRHYIGKHSSQKMCPQPLTDWHVRVKLATRARAQTPRPQMSIFGKVTLVFFLSLLRCICCQNFGGRWKLWGFAGGATGTSESSHNKCDPENENSCLDIGLSIIIAWIEGHSTAAVALRRLE